MTGVCVIGLHRGGTSAVAGVLHHLGVFMGDQLLEPSEDNPKGYFEDRRFMELHTAIMGGDWKRPLENFQRDIWPEFKCQYTTLVREFEEHELWGVKDPRLCYCLPLLQSVVKDELKVIWVHRDPWFAAYSLEQRGGHTFREALNISFEHFVAAYQNTKDPITNRMSGIHVSYDAWMARPTRDIANLVRLLGIRCGKESFRRAVDSIDPDLRHWHGDIWETEEEIRMRENREPVACCPHCGTYGACTYMNEEHIPECAKLHGGEE